MIRKKKWIRLQLLLIVPITLLFSSCRPNQADTSTAVQVEDGESTTILQLPEIEAIELNGSQLKVVATTSVIADVVAQVGGEAIDLTTLIEPGQDPHSYEAAAQDLTAVAGADVIFINGWDLEETLVHDLAEIGQDALLVPISADIQPLIIGKDGHHHAEASKETAHNGVDPHVWFNIDHVEQWVVNVRKVLSALDPAHVETYESNADVYLSDLAELVHDTESQLAQIPAERRFLVTNHDSFSYFAQAYDFEVIGTVLPDASTLAEPSASDLAQLVAEMETHNLCTIFIETAVTDSLSQTVAEELDNCSEVKIIPLYSGGLGAIGSGADTYIGMMRANVDAIVSGSRP